MVQSKRTNFGQRKNYAAYPSLGWRTTDIPAFWHLLWGARNADLGTLAFGIYIVAIVLDSRLLLFRVYRGNPTKSGCPLSQGNMRADFLGKAGSS